jgi:uncharacterized protein (TIGR02996 family)
VIGDVVPKDRWPQVHRLRQLAELACLDVTYEVDGGSDDGCTITVTCGGRVKTLRIATRVGAFPDILVAYLNDELARLGVNERLVCCRSFRDLFVALADPPELARLRMLQLATAEPLVWPADPDADDVALLAGIRASPEDDAPRLVYADRLASRGDPRGRYIALACSNDPANQARARGIEDVYRCLWTAHLPAWISCASFVRGFIEVVETSEEAFFEHHDAVHALMPVPRVACSYYSFILSPDGRLAIARQTHAFGGRPGPRYRVFALARVSAVDVVIPANVDPGIDVELDPLADLKPLAALDEPFVAFGFTPDSRAAWFRSKAGVIRHLAIDAT